MMAGANRDAFGVENGSEIMRMYAIDHERKNCCFAGSRAYQADARQFGKLLCGEFEQLMLVRIDGVKPQLLDILDSSIESDDTGDIWRACLESLRDIGVGASFEAYGVDHVAAALPGRHIREYVVTRIQGADAGGSIKLVTRECIEIAVECLHIDLLVCYSLGAIYQHLRSNGVCQLDDFGDRI